MRVTVLRAFLLKAERQEPGSTIELADDLARELIAVQKVQPAQPLAAPAGPMTTDSAAPMVAGKQKKEKGHAGKSSASL